MSTSPLLTLLNPALSLVFATAFLVVWRYQPHRTYLIVMALSYSAVSIGFLFQYYTLPMGLPWTRMISNAFFLVAALLMVIAICWRYDRRPPLIAACGMAAAALACVAWFMFVQPSVVGRIYAMNFAVGALLLLIAAEIRAASGKNVFDKFLLAVFVVNGVMMLGRTIATVQFGADLRVASDLHTSLYWMIFTFTHALISLVSVLAIIGTVAADIVIDLKTKTETDLLSGLLNRRGFEQAAKDLLDKAGKLPAALFIADLDHFKSINDNFGHEVGDRVIACFASVLERVVGRTHPIGRIGGEEFAVILRGADLKTARLVAEGVRIAFTAAPTPGRALGKTRRLTASFGVAQWRQGESYSELLGRADTALYDAKNAGRDKVRMAAEMGDDTLTFTAGGTAQAGSAG